MSVVGRLMRAVALPAIVMALPFSATAQGLIRDAEIERTLRSYADPLFLAAGLKPEDVNLYIVQSDEVQASVAGGQNMFVYTGLIMQSRTPEELKGVMAHEIGHIALGHNITRPAAAGASSGISLVTMGLGALALFVGAPEAAMALFGSASQFGMLTFFKFTRAEEAASDLYGIGLLEKTGQSANGFADFMEGYRYQELMTENRRSPYWRSHPIWSDRIGAVTKKATEISNKARPQTPEEQEGLIMMQAKLTGFLGPPNRVLTRFPGSDQSVAAKYARAIAAYKAVDIKAALTLTQGLIDADPDNPYFEELKGQILFESGRAAESVEPHRKSVQLAPQHALLKVNLARSLTATKDEAAIKEAEGLLIDALALEEDNAFAWTFLADVYAKQSRIGDADLATAEASYQVGNMSRAHIFAKRARDKLTLNTPNGQRADDIMALSDPRNRPR
ncbi:MAG TPA: M48 family metalloprotease [Hyphomonadaceae bacterium]|nr:M48 family metalloprotease [Hyphomonadaceae bacterium]HPN04229.1 M48 family metalloprotease [Hyphomonadaceae bacterium]